LRHPVDVPDQSSLLVEGTFDSARAGAVRLIVSEIRPGDSTRLMRFGTWQLDSSGGSVVFKLGGASGLLVVEATIGSVDHYFLFTVRVTPAGGS